LVFKFKTEANIDLRDRTGQALNPSRFSSEEFEMTSTNAATERTTLARLTEVSTPPSDVRPPQQKRSQESFERVLEAGGEILREVGFGGFTLQAVSERAGVGVGSIYLRVPSREALLIAIHDREMSRMDVEDTELIADVVEGEFSPSEHVERLVTAVGGYMLRNGDILAVFMTIAPSDSEIWRKGSERSREVGERFRAAMDPVRPHIAHPDPDLAIDIVYRVVYDTIARRISRGEGFESDRDLADATLLEELARVAVSYLFTPNERS
jgi:AcrR family transcriptional regulator